MKNRFSAFMKNLKEVRKKPEMQILPGQLAFFLLLSIIPFCAIVSVIATRFNISVESILNAASDNLPQEVYDFISDLVSGRSNNINIIIFSILGFILASNGPHSMIIGSNLLYNIPIEDSVSRRIKAILMAVILVILFIFVLLVPAFGDQIVRLITDAVPYDSVDKTIVNLYNILKYPISIFIIFFFVKLLYVMAPDKTIKSRTTTKGAIVTTFGWIVATEIYSFYVKEFATYNILYGSVANLLILFMWIYILSYIFVLGMALNAASYNTDKEE